MNEVILKIEEISFSEGKWSGFDGVRVTTSNHIYEAGISNDQQCCEDWGYTINEDKDAQTYVGAILHDVNSDGTFTNFNTHRGTLNFTCYNEHNGYYSHSCVLKRDGITIEESSI